jgi:hypothetical protein
MARLRRCEMKLAVGVRQCLLGALLDVFCELRHAEARRSSVLREHLVQLMPGEVSDDANKVEDGVVAVMQDRAQVRRVLKILRGCDTRVHGVSAWRG